MYDDLIYSAKVQKGGCRYLIVSDSIKVSKNRVKYTRYRQYATGGQGLAFNEIFVLEQNQLIDLVNNLRASKLDASELIRFRTEENYF